MVSDDDLRRYLGLSLADRWAIQRALPTPLRAALARRLRAHRHADAIARRRAANPASFLKCTPSLARHLVKIAIAEAPATNRARASVRAAIDKFSVA